MIGIDLLEFLNIPGTHFSHCDLEGFINAPFLLLWLVISLKVLLHSFFSLNTLLRALLNYWVQETANLLLSYQMGCSLFHVVLKIVLSELAFV